MSTTIIFFYGTDCPHCELMTPLLAKASFETGVVFDEREVWENQANFRVFENYQELVKKNDPECDGLPFLYCVETGDYLCGEVNYKTLKSWILKNQG